MHTYPDSKAGLQLLARGPSHQSTCSPGLVERSPRTIRELSNHGTSITFQWVPGHAGLLGNEEADRLANLGSSEEQDRIPIDLNSAKGAIRKLAKNMAHRRAKAAHLDQRRAPKN